MQLSDKIESITKLTKPQSAALKKLGLFSARDLLLHFPYRYLDFSKTAKIKDLKPEEMVSVKATIKSISSRFSFRGRMNLAEAVVSDDTGSIKVVWFNQGYLAKTLTKGEEIFLAGTPEYYNFGLQLTNPIYEKLSDFPVHTARLVPVYHLKTGLYPRTLRNLIKTVLPLANEFEDELPPAVLKNQDLLNFQNTIRLSHFPESLSDVEMAKKRLAFEEIFISQLAAQKYKLEIAQKQAFALKFDQNLIKNFVDSLPFQLTAEQKKAAWEILRDLEKPQQMNRLLEGDVGSGKTLVALIAALQTVSSGYQTVFLAPTEILAKQHFETAIKFLNNPKVDGRQKLVFILLTNNFTKFNNENIAKTKLQALIKEGMPGLFIGTHALLQKDVNFKNLALVIIDEQHRFGVNQRAALIRRPTQTDSQTDADKTLLYENLTYTIRKCVFEVKKEIGLGHKEIIYQNALLLKFKEKGIVVEKEKNIPIIYKNTKIGSYQPDFVMENKIILELKALPFIGRSEEKQIWTYLKGSEYKLALLINFAPDDVHIKRVVYDTAREGQRKSASSPRQSALSNRVPHLLSLSATPIPRTLKLAFFGELDISQIKTKPADRKPIITKLVEPTNRQKAYDFIAKQIKVGKQAFVITPLIEDSEILTTKSAKTEAENLQKIFPQFKIGLLHGKLKSVEKEKVMAEFLANEIQILVSTSVVEVGVDVPNASVMLIEGAERFGLAQLHQFRGRVGRAEHQSYCFLFQSDPPSPMHGEGQGERLEESSDAEKRLQAFTKTQDGFELAEADLKQRGFGEIYGAAQSGWDYKYFDLSYTSLIEPAREEAKKLLADDASLSRHPKLWEKIKNKVIHFE